MFHEDQKKLIHEILVDIRSGRRKKVIIDTDTYNEMDDQYSVIYSVCAADRLDVLAINAAPFLNDRVKSFSEGADASYEELERINSCFDNKLPLFRGSRESVTETKNPCDCPASRNIIKLARESDERIYILALGAITNVASAVMMAPDIKENICIIWLAGQSLNHDSASEFNLSGDYNAGQFIINSGTPLLLCPAWDVTAVLRCGYEELTCTRGFGKHGDFLANLADTNYIEAGSDPKWERIIWDIAAPAILANNSCAEIEEVIAPVFTDDYKYAFDSTRHGMLLLKSLNRDSVYADCWKTIKNY